MQDWRADVVSIVAGGWSFSQVPHELVPGTVICVNDAALYFRGKISAVVSMDRLWTEGRWDFLCSMMLPSYVRKSALQNLDWRGFPWVRCFECDHETVQFAGEEQHRISETFSENPGTLNGTNSAACAQNLAYLMSPRELYLFGFDLQRGPAGQTHWYPPYPWAPGGATTSGKYREWSRQHAKMALQFESIGCRVRNVSNRSLIEAYRVCWLEDLQRRAA